MANPGRYPHRSFIAYFNSEKAQTFIRPLKTSVRRLLLAISLVALSLFLLSYLNFGINDKSVPQKKVLSKVSSGLPVRLTIPAINVNAEIEHVGVNTRGEMEVPSNTVDVGWFKIGPRPGEKGSAVISGHFDGKDGKAGVFNNLHKLKKGDKIFMKDDKGKTTAFIVRESRIYNSGYAEEVFSLNDSAHLNLVTCDGVWDKNKKSYTKRLVVFTDAI